MRGQRSIYTSLFEEEISSSSPTTLPEKKGRSEELIQRRNEALICRYYYHVKIVRLQYLIAVQLLESEFYLAQRTVIDILSRNANILKEVQTTKPDVEHFRQRFPYLAWVKPK